MKYHLRIEERSPLDVAVMEINQIMLHVQIWGASTVNIGYFLYFMQTKWRHKPILQNGGYLKNETRYQQISIKGCITQQCH